MLKLGYNKCNTHKYNNFLRNYLSKKTLVGNLFDLVYLSSFYICFCFIYN